MQKKLPILIVFSLVLSVLLMQLAAWLMRDWIAEMAVAGVVTRNVIFATLLLITVASLGYVGTSRFRKEK
ncbi:hypothetical protein [Chromobacterium subtsugae]|uniref:hypothetical protein n=1 Tax=Chromobacterium subtsugae TaxID=251747 RepID=UPI00128C4D6D|nr:hypothetical protein [Chromobacterium subtsugae]